jgi:DNA topoisomerase-1
MATVSVAPDDGVWATGPRSSAGATARLAQSTGAFMGLYYSSDADPGIRRRRAGRGFSYRDPHGRTIRDPERIAWIRSLAVPPAWTDVWICPRPDGHLLATGRDARGRKQYRYHPRFRASREAAKFDHLARFGRRLPRLRRRVAADLRRPGLPREKVLAAVVALLESTAIRVGNEAYARENRSYGLTTLRPRHAATEGDTVQFTFRGKSGKAHRVRLRDRRLARVVRRCQELPGQRLFQYLDDDGDWAAVTSDDVNAYLREAIGDEFSAKDFRTWVATLAAFEAIDEGSAETARDPELDPVKIGLERAAASLGNTVAVCRRSYVHPAVLEPVRGRQRRAPRRDSRWRSASEASLIDRLAASARR